MSTLRTNNLQNPDSAGVNIVMTEGGGAIFSGIVTAPTLNVTGVLTYDDVTNIDSVGIITAQSGIHVTDGSVGIGTDNPQDSLDVASAVPQIRLTDTSDGSYGQIRANGGNLILRADEGNSISDSVILAEIDGDEKFRITSGGNIGIGTDNPTAAYKLHVSDVGGTIALHNASQSNTIRYTNNNTTAQWSAGTSRPGLTNAGNYYSITHLGTDSTWRERFTLDSAGTIKCGTSATLKAEINSAIGGHQFISQCDDNNNGFEIYQQHGSTTTRNTFAVYANTGGGGAQELQFSIRGDGCVTKPKSPAFSANLAGSDLNAATHNNVIVFNNEHFDKSGSYDTSNGRFTAPVAGLYYFGVQIYAGFALSGVRVLHSKFVKNGSDVASADMFGGASDHGGTSYHPTGCGHFLTELAVNDWVAFNSGGFSGSGSGHATIYAANGTRFFGYLVG